MILFTLQHCNNLMCRFSARLLIFSFYNIPAAIDNFINDLRSGNQLAFRQLIDTYQQKVMNTAMGMVQDTSAAEDITQEVFVVVFKTILSFKEDASLSTWIYRITVNKCLDHLRARDRRKKAGFLSVFFNQDASEAAITDTNFIHPGVLLEKKDDARLLFNAINTLPENQKTAFVLAHIEELPQKEIAGIMNISVKAVESLLQRAKGNLRKVLAAKIR